VAEIEMTRGINEAETGIRQLVGNNVKAAREYAGLSQRDLAEKAGIGQAYLSQCETGKWNVGIDNIARIARATGFLPHDLMHPKFDPAEFARTKRGPRSRAGS
jgi:transcriptional regulator with XRE-family HTH domain